MWKPNVIYKLDWLTEVMTNELKNLVEKPIKEDSKMSSSLKNLYKRRRYRSCSQGTYRKGYQWL